MSVLPILIAVTLGQQASPAAGETIFDVSRDALAARAYAYSDRRKAAQQRLNDIIDRAPTGPCRELAIAARGLWLGGLDAEFLLDDSHLSPLLDRAEELQPASDDGEAAKLVLQFYKSVRDGTDGSDQQLVGTLLRQARTAEAAALTCVSRP